jgi:hydrocephalus-inducing protein
MKVPIVFTPRDIEKYNEIVTLNINGLHTVDIQIMGEGVPFKIDLDKQED